MSFLSRLDVLHVRCYMYQSPNLLPKRLGPCSRVRLFPAQRWCMLTDPVSSCAYVEPFNRQGQCGASSSLHVQNLGSHGCVLSSTYARVACLPSASRASVEEQVWDAGTRRGSQQTHASQNAFPEKVEALIKTVAGSSLLPFLERELAKVSFTDLCSR